MGTLSLLGLSCVPETPRFLAKAKRVHEAKVVLIRLRGDETAAQDELDGILADLQGEAAAGVATWREILHNAAYRNVVLIGCFVQFAQIITGVNALVSFSGTMFAQLGVGGIVGALLPFVANLLANMLGSFALVDRVGRRPILLLGMTGMATTLLVAGAATTAGLEGAGGIAVACVIGYMTCFGGSWGYGASSSRVHRAEPKGAAICTFSAFSTHTPLTLHSVQQLTSRRRALRMLQVRGCTSPRLCRCACVARQWGWRRLSTGAPPTSALHSSPRGCCSARCWAPEVRCCYSAVSQLQLCLSPCSAYQRQEVCHSRKCSRCLTSTAKLGCAALSRAISLTATVWVSTVAQAAVRRRGEREEIRAGGRLSSNTKWRGESEWLDDLCTLICDFESKKIPAFRLSSSLTTPVRSTQPPVSRVLTSVTYRKMPDLSSDTSTSFTSYSHACCASAPGEALRPGVVCR